ncbi:MAG: DNA repair protein RecN [Gemmatimonadales bacterium]|jgi:DNA repair protein RecN (Recombination protein N)|nr:MAG: DNA repair protein RecN [Gemmatimonadales bacterium]
MLIELRIRDFAVIQDLTLPLGPGLNVLTGETGAGKSIIVDALALLLGERASSEDVRAGSARALVEGVFDVSSRPQVLQALDEMGMASDDGLVILRREVQAEGRNRAWINGSPATASAVGTLGAGLVDLHGQHDHQTLLRRGAQREILDAFAGARTLAAQVRARFDACVEARRTLASRTERLRQLEAEGDFLRFQLEEIQAARIEPGEEGALQEEAQRLSHSQELAAELSRAHELLYAGEGAISDRLAEVGRLLTRVVRLDPGLGSLQEMVEAALQSVQEAGRAAGTYAADVEHDPLRLQAIEHRRDLLFKLKRKYGPELQDVLDTEERLVREVRELRDADDDLAALESQLDAILEEVVELSARLSRAREGAAQELAQRVERLLPALGMTSARVEIALLPEPEMGRNGAESVEFRVALNEGFEPRGLARVASGGELSRVMLALKTVLAEVDQVPTLVFDEIDAGIGGTVAHGVAETLSQVARHHQVFVITHLAQLASRAEAHLLVEKGSEKGIATTRVECLAGEDRIHEIARMLGGDPGSEASLEHARSLLASVE